MAGTFDRLWRLHMQLDLVSFCPHKTELTGARKSGAQGEIQALRRSLEPDRCYVDNGGYAAEKSEERASSFSAVE